MAKEKPPANGNGNGNASSNPFIAFGRSSASVLSEALLRASSGPTAPAAAAPPPQPTVAAAPPAAAPQSNGAAANRAANRAPAGTPARDDVPVRGGPASNDGNGNGSGNGNGNGGGGGGNGQGPSGSGKGPEKKPGKGQQNKPYSAEADSGRWAGLGFLGLAATGLYVNDVDVTRLPSVIQASTTTVEQAVTVTGPTMLQKAQAAAQQTATAEGAKRLASQAAEKAQRAAQALQTQYVRPSFVCGPSPDYGTFANGRTTLAPLIAPPSLPN